MFRSSLALLALVAFLFTAVPAQNGFDYPKAKKIEQVDDYHGTKVSDPYRWMEDSKSPDLQSWIEAENKITDSYLASIPQREAIKNRLTELWNYERYSLAVEDRQQVHLFEERRAAEPERAVHRGLDQRCRAAYFSIRTNFRPTARRR